MMLITKEIAAKLVKADQNLINGGDDDERDEIIVKFFNPCGAATWYIVSATPLDAVNGEADYENFETAKDWHMFGFCDLGLAGCAELGYVLLSELAAIKTRPFGLGIERDRHYTGSLKAVMDDYRKAA